jgi:hypothetical protein
MFFSKVAVILALTVGSSIAAPAPYASPSAVLAKRDSSGVHLVNCGARYSVVVVCIFALKQDRPL